MDFARDQLDCVRKGLPLPAGVHDKLAGLVLLDLKAVVVGRVEQVTLQEKQKPFLALVGDDLDGHDPRIYSVHQITPHFLRHSNLFAG